ncbi:MAG: metallophosphoesterase family protein [Candidatus Hodarchaeales archaeon]|jgi:DNA repair exonuclease SbcCD nuclease subunit
MNTLEQDKNPEKNIKFLFISDTHFGVHYAIKPRNKLRYQYGSKFFTKVESIFRRVIEEKGIDFILHGGDFFNRSKPPPDVIKRATESLLWAAKYVPIYMIPGNHERSKLPLGLLQYHENIHIFSKPCSFQFKKNNVKVKISGFPYIRHNARKKARSVISTAWKNEVDVNSNNSHYNILLMHQLIQGSRVEHYSFIRGHNVIQKKDIPSQFHLVATGHVHRYQILYSRNNRVVSSHSYHQIAQDLQHGQWHFPPSGREEPLYYSNPIICYSGSSERVSMMERNEDKGYVMGKIYINESNKKQVTKADLNFIPVPSTEMSYIKWDFKAINLEQAMKEGKLLIQTMNRKSTSSSLAGVIHISILNSEGIPYSKLTPLTEYAKEMNVLLTLRIKNPSLPTEVLKEIKKRRKNL